MRILPLTRGMGEPGYSLYIPLHFPDIHRLEGFGNQDAGWTNFDLAGAQARLEVVDTFAILRVREYSTQAAAEAAFRKIANGLFRAVASRRGAVFPPELRSVETEAPHIYRGFPREFYEPWPPKTPEADGFVMPRFAYVLPEHQRIVQMPMGFGKIVRSLNPAELARWLEAGKDHAPVSSEKDLLALSLIAQANAQRSPTLEFLNLIRALEVLIEDKALTHAQAALVNEWRRVAEEAVEGARQRGDTATAEELAEVKGRLKHINQGIQAGLRQLVKNVPLLEVRHPDNVGLQAVPDLAQQVSAIYAVRSELTHDGRVGAKKGQDGATRLVETLSRVRYVIHCVLSDRL